MKITEIAKKCKAARYAAIIDRGDCQFVGTGEALYKLPNLPYITPGNIPVLFNISEKSWLEDWNSDHIQASSISMPLDDSPGDELALECENIIIFTGTEKVTATIFQGVSSSEMILIPTWTLKGINQAECEFCIRKNKKGHPTLVAKRGMLLEAAIMPIPIMPITLAGNLRDLADRIEAHCKAYKEVGYLTERIMLPEEELDKETTEQI